MAKQTNRQTVKDITPNEDFLKRCTLHIAGTTELIVHKRSNSAERYLLDDDRKAQKLWESQHKNEWEDVITSIHWRDKLVYNGEIITPDKTNAVACEEMMLELLEKNAPCISAFGLKESWKDAVVRFGLDKNKTKFDAAVTMIESNMLIPFKFDEWHTDTRLIAPNFKSPPVPQTFSHFSGWSADIHFTVDDSVFSMKEVMTAIKKAGAGVGIGSGRKIGYGRYTITSLTGDFDVASELS